MTKKEKLLLNEVNAGFNYFNSGFLEELTTDKRFYVETFMKYIESLERKIEKASGLKEKIQNA